MRAPKFKMWDVLKERVSGFEGVVLGISFYSTGCIHYGLVSQTLHDGKPMDWEWFDESRLDLVKKTNAKAITKPTSGPDMNPRQH